MHKNSKIYIAGHKGLVGSAILQELQSQGYTNLIYKTHDELDLINQSAVNDFFKKQKPEYVFFSAAFVGGFIKQRKYPAEFLYNNIMMQNNVIHAAATNDTKKLIYIASACVYPKDAPLPLKESYMLSGAFQPNNESYAIGKVAGIKLCEYLNLEKNTNFLCVAPTSIYGENDNFDIENSHVQAGIFRKIYLAKQLNEGNMDMLCKDLNMQKDLALEFCKKHGIFDTHIKMLGTGTAAREFANAKDLANFCIHLACNINFKDLCEYDENGNLISSFVNFTDGTPINIKELSFLIAKLMNYKGELIFQNELSKDDGTLAKTMSVEKFNKLGFKNKISIQDGLKKMIELYNQKNL
ncbi:NAD-dependent epimerase/dehydratase family protein [Campylobacter gastrosuis]|uniref:GDP-L-fucose synthase n=1 Tax=Campylobacter gastrosuis TaxID=2974576 RepID=A0ABT7HR49_9BACT|nr:NAD-dependent epimerase/dehydratase family protein [Campylobacter gastrosuis]MDL0089340.1 NAD-dependent epimerase/dehydratase family protein [Campylobacter gastrosuis]